MTKGQKIGVGIGLGLSALAVFFVVRSIKRSKKVKAPSSAPPEFATPPLVPELAPVAPAPVGSWFQSCSAGSGALDPAPAAVPSAQQLQDENEIAEGLHFIATLYGPDIAKNVERIYRLETSHFKSGQYLSTGSAGMIPTAKTFPYGWGSLAELWKNTPESAPVGVVRYCAGGKIYPYLAFRNFYGFVPVAEKLKRNNNNAGSWYSTDPAQQAVYSGMVKTISAKLV